MSESFDGLNPTQAAYLARFRETALRLDPWALALADAASSELRDELAGKGVCITSAEILHAITVATHLVLSQMGEDIESGIPPQAAERGMYAAIAGLQVEEFEQFPYDETVR